MVTRVFLCGLALLEVALADTLTLKDGTKITGTFLGGDSRQIRLLVGEATRSYAITEVQGIRFGADTGSATAAAPAATRSAAPPASSERILRPAPAASAAAPAASARASAAAKATVPEGTQLTVRMIDDVDSERDQVGQTFRATLDEPLMADGREVVARGADVVIKLTDDKEAGKLTGRTELTLDLQTITVNGKVVAIDTQTLTQQSGSRTRQTATRTGGGAALGAIIGAIAGGGKGAAIGAAVGAGAGAGSQILTKGPKVRIPSETRLTFTLAQPVTL
ncbi:MAG: hypothetical protein SFV54_03190 [Bryobacteraceae bacterium]|nr:hypothetical protein [Bryobacteraceae bacterium]